jgi:hypothetical protein
MRLTASSRTRAIRASKLGGPASWMPRLCRPRSAPSPGVAASLASRPGAGWGHSVAHSRRRACDRRRRRTPRTARASRRRAPRPRDVRRRASARLSAGIRTCCRIIGASVEAAMRPSLLARRDTFDSRAWATGAEVVHHAEGCERERELEKQTAFLRSGRTSQGVERRGREIVHPRAAVQEERLTQDRSARAPGP